MSEGDAHHQSTGSSLPVRFGDQERASVPPPPPSAHAVAVLRSGESAPSMAPVQIGSSATPRAEAGAADDPGKAFEALVMEELDFACGVSDRPPAMPDYAGATPPALPSSPKVPTGMSAAAPAVDDTFIADDVAPPFEMGTPTPSLSPQATKRRYAYTGAVMAVCMLAGVTVATLTSGKDPSARALEEEPVVALGSGPSTAEAPEEVAPAEAAQSVEEMEATKPAAPAPRPAASENAAPVAEKQAMKKQPVAAPPQMKAQADQPEVPSPRAIAASDEIRNYADGRAFTAAQLKRAARHEAQGETEQALSVLSQAWDVFPKDPHLAEQAARIELARGQSYPARRWAERAVRLRPTRARYHVLMGDVLRSAGNERAATDAFEQALKVQPGYPDAVARLR